MLNSQDGEKVGQVFLKRSGSIWKITLTLAALMAASFANTQARAVPSPVRYECPASEDLAVLRNRSTAHVNYAGRSYELERKRSSIGNKYVSPNAALIIDGNSAIFIAEDLLDLGTCTKAVPVASAR